MKRHVKFRSGLSGDRFSYRRGELRWLDKADADALIKAGIAEAVQEAEEVKAELVALKEQLAGGVDPEVASLAAALAAARAALAEALATA